MDHRSESMRHRGDAYGQDDEELFEYAMHPAQYEAYKSGKAKSGFLEDLAKKKTSAEPKTAQPESIVVTVNGQSYKVSISYDGKTVPSTEAQPAAPSAPVAEGNEVLSPLEGKFMLSKIAGERKSRWGTAWLKMMF